MQLTGIPLIALVGAGAAAAWAATVWLWSRASQRRRLLVRTVCAVGAELLVVATIALIDNRRASFYPSWADLIGGDAVVTEMRAPAVAVGRPHGRPAERTAVVVPPGDVPSADIAYPVIVVLCAPGDINQVRAAARHTSDVVTLVVSPATASEVTDRIAELLQELSVTDHDWALVTDAGHRELATRLGEGDRRFGVATTVAGGDRWAAALAGAAGRLPPPLASPLVP